MQRLDSGTGDYLNELKEHFQMQCLLALVSELIDNTEMKCLEYRQKFLEHSFLWLDSIQDSFNNFLADGAKDLVENFEEERLTRFTQMKTSISNLKTPVDIHWLRINIQPVKIHLVQFAGKWEYTYTNYLQEFCEGRIGSLCRFIDKVNDGLTQHSPADDPENEKLLYATMTHIRDVKLAMEATKLLFNPIREQVQTLKKHGVVLPEEQLQELDLAPARWEEVIRAAFDEKEKILPLQSAEMLKIRRKIDAFAGEVAEYRSTFLRECPFAAEHTYEEAYGKLDDFYERTMAMVERAKEYNNLELLFDMAMSGYRELKDSQEDLVLLKNLWDAIALINFTFEDWNSTLWDRINTDDLLMRVKELGTQVKAMPKEIRGWKLYAWLQDIVKNMSTVLPLISDLHSETMRDRHWNQLMDVTGTTFTKGPEFCFKDLLDLELYKFADDVSEIVDQSVKEAKIEKKLSTIRTTWTKLTLEFDHSREDCPLLKELGEVVEILESHSLEMMGMVSQGRFIEFCQAVVDEWSTKLRTVDSVLTVWQKVQRNWCRLEPIFMLSDDIRSQLPEDSKRFEALDAEWKDLMVDASQSSNAVEICCAEGREEVLHRLNEAIEACEKSLNDYLEQKKKAFPRFYFVANQALLDILSNGNRPLKVAEYLGDCFDGVKSLNFEKDPVNGRIGTGIISKDKEYVPFYEDVVLEGAVETYLTNLESHIRCTLRDILDNARATAENWEVDKPREIWLQDYCAQLALVTTQLVWTEETARAFDELEGGSETAMKDYKRVCDDRIEKLIKQVVGEKGPTSWGLNFDDLKTKSLARVPEDVRRTAVEFSIVWYAVQKLIEQEGFESFAQNMEKDAPNRFKEWFNELAPEDQKLPLDWKKLDSQPLQKMLVMRCLRPDRMTIMMGNWIRKALPHGREYMDCDGSSSFYEVLSNSFEDSSNVTPIFFILSPGADPVKEVEALGRKVIQLQINVNYHNVAMGQGQDVVAMAKLDMGHKEGHWIMLQNIHLMPRWCTELEKKLDNFAIEGSHPNFRCFLSADPSNGIPIGILERSIKLTNEPPQGLLANLRRAFAFFNKEDFEERDSKVKSILFGLCHFHGVMLERKKFGPLGYNMMYPFSIGDLRDSASVLYNYLENASSVKVPWDDLRYIFGEIMYGGHIVDDWDRKLCRTYLEFFMHDELLDETELVPFTDPSKLSFLSPAPSSHEKYLEHIELMPVETPQFFGLHPNAEIGFRTAQSNTLFQTLLNLDARSGGSGGGDEDAGESMSPLAMAEAFCNDILDDVRDIKFPVDDISRSMPDEEKGPYQYVFLQECSYMNELIFEMVRSLQELQLGFKGELTMSETMENLSNALILEIIPPRWAKLAFPSTRPLRSWLTNLKERCAQLEEWTNDPSSVPKVVDVSKFFNPQSFLTAIKQLCCQQQMLELDKLMVFTEVTKREKSQIESFSREGAYVTGMFLEGARWDINGNCLDESKPKEMFCKMPVINCKAGLADETGSGKSEKGMYICPIYCTPQRRPYFVFAAQLRTKHSPAKWVLAGVAMILDIGVAV
ncbi:hypothetical protein FOZ60_016205 [Perkinsus olseni]|uniref:Dynein heavy chain 1, axonemal n=1 Tax=Perkinsus olseni TaxID=32597 RepID=A0A7J6P4X8_PEROL|nr:hypothetical protein FOZ60_016205 [Perkinsus olseni]